MTFLPLEATIERSYRSAVWERAEGPVSGALG
jgi:hypothetical protein